MAEFRYFAIVGKDNTHEMSEFTNVSRYIAFAAEAYLSANSDLASVYGDNIEGIIEHYVLIGVNEDRIATVSDAVKAGVVVVK